MRVFLMVCFLGATAVVGCGDDDCSTCHGTPEKASIREASIRDASIREASIREASIREASIPVCASPSDCAGDDYCDLTASPPTCRHPPTGQGTPCKGHDDCAAF